MRALQGQAVLDRDHRILQTMATTRVIVDVARSYNWYAQAFGKLSQTRATPRITLN